MSEDIFKALHAIQLVAVETRELFIRLNGPIDDGLAALCKDKVKLNSAHSDFDPEEGIVNVGLRLSLGMEEGATLPLSMRVEVVGTFTVDTSGFDEAKVSRWAEQNAPLILYPYIREHSFGLTTRCGLEPVILPLLQVPTLTATPGTDNQEN